MATILIVDDRPINREFLGTLLRYAGYQVLDAADGAQALEVVRAQRPNLVISDILMPTMDGIEFANAVHGDETIADTQIIFYTATYRSHEARALAQSCGVSTVLAKPAEPQEILDAVTTALGGHPASDSTLAAVAAPPSPAFDPSLPAYLRDLVELQKRLQHALSEGAELLAEGGALREVSERLVQSYGRVQGLSLRLAALLELGLGLSLEREPRQLLDVFCSAAQDIMNARYALVGVNSPGDGSWRFASRGFPAGGAEKLLAALEPKAGILGEVLVDGAPRRLHEFGASPLALGLPPSHPPIQSLVVVPVISRTRPYGWLYFADRLGTRAFSDDDEQFAMTLAAQLAPVYESLVLYGEVQQHAERLETEIIERKRAAVQLRESELRFRQLAENIREVFFLLDPADGRTLYVSPAYATIWGRSCESLYAEPESWAEAIHPEQRQQVMQELQSKRQSGSFDLEFRILDPGGAVRWVRVRGFPIHDEAGRLCRVAGISEDITQQKEQQQKIARLSRIHAVLSGINSAIVRIRDRDELLHEACRIAVAEGVFQMAWIGAVDPETLDGKLVARLGGADGALEMLGFTGRAGAAESDLPASRAVREQHPVICNDINGDPNLAAFRAELGARGHRSLAAFPLIVDDRVYGVLVLLSGEVGFFNPEELELLNELAGDIAFGLQFIEKEERLRYLAYYDVLTDLPNSTLFHDRLTQFLQSAKRRSDTVAAIVVDVDRFTQLNDTLGRHVGDILLREVARRLDQALREPYSVARISADAFAVAVANLQEGTDAATILQERILDSLGRPFLVEGKEIRISARGGIALYPADGEDAGTLFKNAEAALKQAQSMGDRYLYYAPEMNARVAEKLALEGSLRQALERQEFVLHYQPKICTKTGRLVGLEALIRWSKPNSELIPPAAFIPVLEETGMILEAGRWALQRALADARCWQVAGLQPPRIAVNVSAIQLQQRDFVQVVRQVIEDSGCGTGSLELELTESLIMADIEGNTRMLHQLRQMGVSIAMDDFGTGYSSLRYLATLPVDSLKIDRSFITTLAESADSMAIVSTVISLAHALGLVVVAEGVESEEQAKFLRLLKCDGMQGYLCSRPVPAAACGLLLEKNRGLPPPA